MYKGAHLKSDDFKTTQVITSVKIPKLSQTFADDESTGVN